MQTILEIEKKKLFKEKSLNLAFFHSQTVIHAQKKKDERVFVKIITTEV